MNAKKSLNAKQKTELLSILQDRFDQNPKRHKGLTWQKVESKLKSNDSALWSINEMEKTGGEPDVVLFDKKSNEIMFVDCSAESPDRRSLCFDQEALEARKQNKPKDSAMNMAQNMGVELLDEKQYRALQKLGEFDLKTSSWIQTPDKIRELGGALFADRRYDSVFVYHNGADSYYASRGFRALIKI